MRFAYNFSVFSLLVLLSLVPVCQAATITIDGDSSDWAGMPPLVTDSTGDGAVDAEDIVECYVTDDCEHLCFLVVFLDGTPDRLEIYIDSDQDRTTGWTLSLGVDCKIIINIGPGEPTGVYIWDKDAADFDKVADPMYSFGDSLLEICIALAYTGFAHGDSIDLIFWASMSMASDYAPDFGEYVTYTLNVCEPQAPVGGDVFQTDNPLLLTPYLLVSLVIVTTASMLIKQRRK